ncbi:MAG: type II toxin-antitoxin system VapC family toxin, partial [Methanophagales archaeon]|nr:type II toxin-antitoxin system VapC family toxin [Methanophagales archaeon]
MNVLVYLDSSAIVKRYIKEAGTEIMDLVFGYAEDGHIKLFFSIWNIGEVLGIFDRYKRRKVINEDEFKEVIGRFTKEFTKLAKLQYLDVVPLHTSVITDAMGIIFLTSHLGIRLERDECIVIFDEVTKMPNERENY